MDVLTCTVVIGAGATAGMDLWTVLRARLLGGRMPAHYLIGTAFAGILLATWGVEWARQPTLGPALIVGLVSVAAPFLIMQPGMGAGIAASRTAKPGAARAQSLLTHTVFGAGLYAAAWLLAALANA